VNYFKRGLGILTGFWFHTQAAWSNLYLLYISPLYIIFFIIKKRHPFDKLILLFVTTFTFGYALHNAGGGDSFGSRYYLPVIWCYFFAVAEIVRIMYKKFHKKVSITPYALFFILVFYYFAGDFYSKEVAIRSGVKRRYFIHEIVESSIDKDKKAAVFIKRSTKFLSKRSQMDAFFYTKHKYDFSDRIIYGLFDESSDFFNIVSSKFPSRNLYYIDYDENKGKNILKPLLKGE